MVLALGHAPGLAVEAFDRAAHRHGRRIGDGHRRYLPGGHQLPKGLRRVVQAIAVLAGQHDGDAGAAGAAAQCIGFVTLRQCRAGLFQCAAHAGGLAQAQHHLDGVRLAGGCGGDTDLAHAGGGEHLAYQGFGGRVGAFGAHQHHRRAQAQPGPSKRNDVGAGNTAGAVASVADSAAAAPGARQRPALRRSARLQYETIGGVASKISMPNWYLIYLKWYLPMQGKSRHGCSG